MAKKRKHTAKAPRWSLYGLAAVLILSALLVLGKELHLPVELPDLDDVQAAVEELYGYGELSPEPLFPEHDTASRGMGEVKNAPAGSLLEVHVLDVGQALSVFVRAPTGECALIDAGDRDDAKFVTDYLKNQGVKKLDYLIATHAHADHIGGMTNVVDNIPLGRIIMSKIPGDIVPTTKVYTDLLEAVADKGYKLTAARPGDSYQLGSAALEIKGPVKEYGDLNDTSVVTLLTYGSVTFLVEGDAEEESELDMLAARRLRPVDVLVAGHHGSSTSTSQKFLDAVSPRWACISCGVDNKYGHPHEETLTRLTKAGCAILRTDVSGTVKFYTDGTQIQVETQK